MPAVIFDMDGVLVASGPAHAASWKMLARRHGLAITDEQFAATFGQTSRDIIRRLWGPELTDEQIRALDDEKERLYRELITGMVPLTIGVRETLHALHDAGLPLAVATSGPRENVDLVLDETGLRPLLAVAVTGFDVQRGKPAPDCFLLAAERLAAPPRACLVVEDTPAGIEAARNAGMPVIGLAGTHPPERLAEAGATRVAERLNEITPALVRALTETDAG